MGKGYDLSLYEERQDVKLQRLSTWHSASAAAGWCRCALDEVLRGSLVERYLRCGKPNCRCARGGGMAPCGI